MGRVWERLGAQSVRSVAVLGTVAVISSVLSISAVLGWQNRSRRRRRTRLAREAHAAAHDAPTQPLPSVPKPTHTAPPTHDESLVREQLSRHYSFLGEEGMQRIRDSFVIVVGAGGVGSWAALMLLRAGVGRLRLIDFDQVSLSSLNRHACATLADVGRPKVVCCQQFFAKIAPWAHVEPCVRLFRAEDADELLEGHPTYVVDAIDNLDTKVELLKYCAEHNLRVFASMGAGAKADPSRIQISDISTTAEDPLARVVRRELRAAGLPPIPPPGSEDPKAQKQAIEAHCATAWTLPCVYSTEKSDTHLLPLPDEEFEKGAVKELAAFDDFRVRILPVLGPLPAMFGLAAATYILCDVAQYKLEPLAIKGRRKLYEKLFADLNVSESKFPSPPVDIRAPPRKARDPNDVPSTYTQTPGAPLPPRVRIPFGVNDIGYIFEEIFRGRSVVPPHDTLAVGQLERWDPTCPLDYDNVVLFTRPQAREHEKEVLATGRDPAEYWGPNVAAKVEQRRAEERRMSYWR
ncbi:hypothetical protein MEQU1_002621 [Malassezia equina]|uniref:THIF-type NAD/FAD binding fold domain-containing protein n=1 Tax=Malassezia equina TaxID=1381935 RepID=A0AAF0EKR8_9BASI|nr:hypothetical protein MEQU1_002621 [Malassezia equina]